jgi:hypothetical protein
MDKNEWFGKEVIIDQDIIYTGPGPDPAKNPYMQAYARALKEAYAEDDTLFRPPSSIRMGFETGLSRDERYLINKAKSEHLEKMEKDLETENPRL